MRTHTLYYIIWTLFCLLPVNGVKAQSTSRGDVNGDGKVDISDVTTLVDAYLLSVPKDNELMVADVAPAKIHEGYVEHTATTALFSGCFEEKAGVCYGVAYSTTKTDNILNWNRVVSSDSRGGIFSAKVANLSPSTYYYYAFFTSTDSVIGFSAISKFKTSPLESSSLKIVNTQTSWTEAYIETSSDLMLETEQTGIAYRLLHEIGDTIWMYSKNQLLYDGKYSTTIKGLMPDCCYKVRPYIACMGDTIYGACQTIQTKGIDESEDAVDLGLSVRWSSKNLGATNPEERGLFYAWGETTGHAPNEWKFGWTTYSMCEGSQSTMTQYCTNASRGIVDGLSQLLPEDDAATVMLGLDWRMPTDEEFTELRTKCTWEWTKLRGIEGYLVTNNQSAIFLPTTGFHANIFVWPQGGFYWTSSLLPNSFQAWRVQFYDDRVIRFRDNRFYGECIRPVKP